MAECQNKRITVPIHVEVPAEIEEEARKRSNEANEPVETLLLDYLRLDIDWSIND